MLGETRDSAIREAVTVIQTVSRMLTPRYVILSVIVCSSCIYSSADDYPTEAMALLSQQVSASECEFVNTTQRPVSFDILQKAGTHAICAVCHSGPSPTNGFDVTDYNSTKARTLPGNPNGSLLFQMVRSGGPMNAYTSTRPCIVPAIERWIADGANP